MRIPRSLLAPSWPRVAVATVFALALAGWILVGWRLGQCVQLEREIVRLRAAGPTVQQVLARRARYAHLPPGPSGEPPEPDPTASAGLPATVAAEFPAALPLAPTWPASLDRQARIEHCLRRVRESGLALAPAVSRLLQEPSDPESEPDVRDRWPPGAEELLEAAIGAGATSWEVAEPLEAPPRWASPRSAGGATSPGGLWRLVWRVPPSAEGPFLTALERTSAGAALWALRRGAWESPAAAPPAAGTNGQDGRWELLLAAAPTSPVPLAVAARALSGNRTGDTARAWPDPEPPALTWRNEPGRYEPAGPPADGPAPPDLVLRAIERPPYRLQLRGWSGGPDDPKVELADPAGRFWWRGKVGEDCPAGGFRLRRAERSPAGWRAGPDGRREPVPESLLVEVEDRQLGCSVTLRPGLTPDPRWRAVLASRDRPDQPLALWPGEEWRLGGIPLRLTALDPSAGTARLEPLDPTPAPPLLLRLEP